MSTHTTFYQRPNGDEPDIEIEVEFTLTGGHGGSGPNLYDPGEPPEAPEFEISCSTIAATGAAVDLTDDEREKVEADVMDRLADFESDDDYYEDF